MALACAGSWYSRQILIGFIFWTYSASLHPGYLSPFITLQKGTRQGCPLSPLLFDLALEPLARYLEDSDLYSGIAVGQKKVKLAMFADDVVLFLSNPSEQLEAVLQLI